MTAMCIANLIIEHNLVREDTKESSEFVIWYTVAATYPTSYICGIIAILGSIFVLMLTGYHSWIVG